MASLTLSRPFRPRELTHSKSFTRPRLRLVTAASAPVSHRSPGRRALLAQARDLLADTRSESDRVWEIACDRMIDDVWRDLCSEQSPTGT